MTKDERWLSRGAFVFVAMGLVVMLWRLGYGADFSDEAWYLATPYRFVLGAQPYVDELFLMQGSGLVLYPLVKLFVWVQGSADGIILFGRICYLLFSVSIAAFVYTQLLKWMRPWVAVFVAATMVVFVPFHLPALSYNTLALGFFSLSIWLHYRGRRFDYLMAGVFSGLAILAHPSYLFGIVFQTLVVASDRNLKAFGYYALGGLSVGTIPFLFFGVHPLDVWDNYLVTKTMNKAFGNVMNWDKIVRIWGELGVSRVFHWELLLLVGAVYWHKRHKISWLVALLSFLLVPLMYMRVRAAAGGMGLHGVSFYISLMGLLFFWCCKNPDWRLFKTAWLPAVVAAFGVSLASYNGLGTVGIPMVASMVVSFVFLHQALEQKWPWIVVPAAQLCALLLLLFCKQHYFEDPIFTLDHRVNSGPYKGLTTSKKKAQLLESMQTQVRSLENSSGRILFYPHFPAGYLMTQMRPALPTTWGCMGVPPSICMSYLANHHTHQDIAVRVFDIYYYKGLSRTYHERHYLDGLLQAPGQEPNQSFVVFRAQYPDLL